MHGSVMLTATVVILVSVAVFAYLYAPPFVSAFHSNWQQKSAPTTATLRADESSIKEAMIEYVQSMLLDGPKGRHELFTDKFLDASEADESIIPKVNSVQIDQPVIAFSSPETARVRFSQIVRMQNGVRRSQERFLFKRTGGGRWKIDQRASQPVMGSSPDHAFGKNVFLYVKSEDEKSRDRRKIEKLVALWKDARANADIDSVLNVYGTDIWERQGTSKEMWLERFTKPQNISVTNVNIVYPHQLQAEVTLNERIDGSHKQTHNDVRLVLELSDHGWLITDEQSQTLSEQIVQPMTILPKPASIAKAETVPKPASVHQTKNTAAVASKPRPTTKKVANGASAESKPGVVKVAAAERDEADIIKALVHGWATAWSKKNLEVYLGFYSRRFDPGSGVSFEQWRKHRAARIAKPRYIDVKVREIQVKQQSPENAKVSFIQFYRSDTYQDKALKTLTLARESGEWKIAGEYSSTL